MKRIRIALALASVTTGLLLAMPSGASATTSTFNCTGSTATFTVPTGISKLWFDVQGAGGGWGGSGDTSWWGTNNGGRGGNGAQYTGALAVTPGQAITVKVGCKGGSGANKADNGSGGSGGWGAYTGGTGGRSGSKSCGFLCSKNGTGGGGGGGGASGITLGSIYVVAGGGGGGGGGAWNSTGGGAYAATQGSALANGSNGANAGAGNGGGGASGGGGGTGQSAGGGDNGGNGGQNGRSAVPTIADLTSVSFNATGGPTVATDGTIKISYISSDATFSSAPSGTRYESSESIAFSGDSDASFTCSVDGGTYSACTSPKSLSGLSEGDHSLSVKQTVGGLTSDAVTASWTTSKPPSPDITSGLTDLNGGGYASTLTPSIAFSTVSGATVTCSTNGGSSYRSCSSPLAYATFRGAALSDGSSYDLIVKQTTSMGSATRTVSFKVDATAPLAPSFTGVWGGSGTTWSNSTTVTPTVNNKAGDFNNFSCSLDDGAWTDCGATGALTGVSEGSHTLKLKQVDKAGNASAQSTRAFTVDITPPAAPTWVKQAPQYISGANSRFELQWTGDLEAGAYWNCDVESTGSIRWDNYVGRYASGGYNQTWIDTWPSLSPCGFDRSKGFTLNNGWVQALTTYRKDDPGSNWASMTYSQWPDHNSSYFAIRQVDAAGNASDWLRTDWTMDWNAPAAPVVASRPGTYINSGSTTITLAPGESDSTYTCAIDTKPAAPCTSTIALSGLADGYHRVTITQIDHAGQSSIGTVVGFTVDTVAPIAPRVDRVSPSGSTINSDSVTLGFAFADLELIKLSESAQTTTQCSLDGSAWAACTGGSPAGSSQTYSGLSEGAHSFRVRQSDAAGNVGSPTTYSWTVDKTAPAAPTMACPTSSGSTGYVGLRTALKGGVCYIHASPAGGTSTTLDPAFTTESGASLECRATVPTGGNVTGGPSATARAAWAACSTYTGYSRPAWATLTSSGSYYTYEARATDPAGNVGPSTTFKFNVDEAAPIEASLTTKPLALPKTGAESDSTPTFAFTLGGAAPDPSLQTVKCALKPTYWPGSSSGYESSYTDCTAGFTSDELDGGKWSLYWYTEDEVGNKNGSSGGSLFQNRYDFVVLPKPSKPRLIFSESNFSSGTSSNNCDSYMASDSYGEYGSNCPDLTQHKFGGLDITVGTDNDWSNNQAFGAIVDKVECAWEGPGITGLTWSECPNKTGPNGAGTTYIYKFSKKTSGTWTLHTRGHNTVGYGPERVVTFTIDADAPAKPTVTFATPSSQAGKDGEAWKTGPFRYYPTTSPYTSASLPTFNGSSVSFDITPAEVSMADLTNNYWTRNDSSGYRFYSSLICTLNGPVKILGSDGNRVAVDSVSSYGTCDKVIDALQNLNPGASGSTYELSVSEMDGAANYSAPTKVYFRAASGPAKVKDFKTMSSSPTSSDTLTYSLTFDTDVTGLTAADFETTGTSTGWTVDSISGTGAGPYTVTLKGASATDGTVGLKLAQDAGQSATGDASPTAAVEAGSGAKVTIDHTAPGGFATETGGLTNTTSLSYALDFSESVTGLTAADLTVGGTATGWTVTSVSGSGKNWTVTVSAGSGATDGTVKLTLAAGSVLDGASNAGPSADVSTAESTIDRTAPAAPTLTKVPGAKTGESMSSITWTGEDGGRFECSTSTGTWYPCHSPEAVSSETDSSFSVRQVDEAGNTGSAASTTWEYTGSLPGAPDISGAPSGATQATSASLTFGPAQSGGGTFKCSVDGAAYATCTSPLDLTGLADGDHSVSVREVTAAGRNGEVATASWSVDNTAPAKPDVTSAPKSRVNTDSASISFTSEGGATAKCSVDGATATTCTSPLDLSGLSEGSHTVSIYQVDEAGNSGEATDVTWTVDTTAPAPPMLNGKPASTTTETSFSISALDESDATFECKLDSGEWASCANPFAASGLALGEHTVQIRAVDVAGNVGAANTATWTVISEGLPVPTVSPAFSSPTGDSSPRFNLTSDGGNALQCSIDNGAWATCTSPYSTDALGDGEHTLRVRETDGAGAYSTAVSSTFTVDTTAPAKPTVTAQPTDGTTSTSGSVEFTEVSGLTYRCRVDDGAWQDDCHSPVELSGLAIGEHKVRVTATDEAGNQSDAQIADWTISGAAVDPATITTTLATPTKSTTASVEFTLPTDTVSECSLDGADWIRCESPWTGSDLADGSHTLRVRAADVDGNRSPGTPISWTVDTTPPAVPTISSKPDSSTASTSATVAFSSDSGSTFLCSVDGGGYDTCTSPKSLADLEGGAHTLSVKSVDALGNVSDAATASWTVTQPSTPVFRLFPGAKSNQTSELLNWQTAESTSAFQCSLDGAAWAACSPSEANAHSKTLTGLALGDHSFKVRSQVGGGGAWSQAAVVNWTVVNSSSIGAPTITASSALATDSSTGWKWTNTNSPTFTLNASGAVSYECTDLKARGSTSAERLQSEAWHACSAQELSPTGLQESATYGAHTLIARAVDANGVRGPSTELNYRVDTQIQAPTWLANPPRSNKADYDLNEFLGHTGERDDSFKAFQCKVNTSSTWGPCRINATNYPSIGTYRTNGATTTVVARQVDRAGNVSGPTATYSWVHDNSPPPAAVWTAKASGNTTSTSATFSWRMPTAPTGQTYSAICWMGTGWAPCSSPLTLTDLSGGNHAFAVIVLDDAGNESSQINATWGVSRPSVSNVAITPNTDPVGVHTELEATGGALTGEAGASAGRVIWERCSVADTPVCTTVSSKDASQKKYYLVEADMGYKMRVTVTWKTLGGVTTSKTSAFSGMIVPTAAASEFIFQAGHTGPVKGRTMGMKTGRIEGFNGLPDKGVQWQRCTGTTADTCTNITGALGLRYTPVAADVGTRLRAVWSLTAPTTGALKGYQIKSATPLSSPVAAK